MRTEVFGSWKMFIGKKFTVFVRAYRTGVEVRKILDTLIRKTKYDTPVFLRELRPGGFVYDHIENGRIKRTVFDAGLNRVDEINLPVHPEVERIIDEEEFFAQMTISEDVYRNYYITKYFNRHVPSRPLNPFAAKILGDDIEGLMMHHSYTDPFVEYIIKRGKRIIVTDKPLKEVKIPEEDPPDPFELHIIDETNYQKKMLFAVVDGVEIMYPESVTRVGGTVKVPTVTDGIIRLIPVPVNDPVKLLERIEKIAKNPKKIYIHEEKTTIVTDDKKIIVYHTRPPRIKEF